MFYWGYQGNFIYFLGGGGWEKGRIINLKLA
jgi:hypothetical protein